MCKFTPFVGECIQVASFDDFKAAIDQGGPEVVFCGAFTLQKTDVTPFIISRNVDIRCLEQCALFGTAPYLEIGGALSQIRIHNMMFQNAISASAVWVSTFTSLSQTTFCETEFASNIASGGLGAAISIAPHSGLVNIVRSTFTGNSAVRGGAVYCDGNMLNILDSRFVYNKATSTGSAIYLGDGSHVAISGTTFILNSVETTVPSPTDSTDFVITFNPSMSIRDNNIVGEIIDNGRNRVILSGGCEGFWDVSVEVCTPFDTLRR
jgi:predicted outer membrane repeat protein